MNHTSHHSPKSIQPLDDSNEYLLRSPVEINFVLSGLARKHTAISAYYGSTADFATVSIIQVDPRERFLYIDPSPDATANQQLLGSSQIICVTTHDKVKVQFDLAGLVSVTHEGRPAFRTSIPERLLKLQRRHYYRLSVPYNQTIKCTIPLPEQAPIQVEIMDISLGGIGIIGYTADVHLAPGEVYENCTVSLPGFGLITTGLQIRTCFDFVLRSGAHTQRAGCLFLNLSKQAEPLIQRYILEQERKYRSRLTNDEA